MDSHHLREKPRFPGVACHTTPPMIYLPPTLQSSIMFPIHSLRLNSLYKMVQPEGTPWSSGNMLCCFTLWVWSTLFSLVPLSHVEICSQSTRPMYLMLWVTTFPVPKVNSASHDGTTVLGTRPASLTSSEFSTRIHLREGWRIILPILLAQYWLEWQGVVRKNLWTESTNERGRDRGSPTYQLDDLSVLFNLFTHLVRCVRIVVRMKGANVCGTSRLHAESGLHQAPHQSQLPPKCTILTQDSNKGNWVQGTWELCTNFTIFL